MGHRSWRRGAQSGTLSDMTQTLMELDSPEPLSSFRPIVVIIGLWFVVFGGVLCAIGVVNSGRIDGLWILGWLVSFVGVLIIHRSGLR